MSRTAEFALEQMCRSLGRQEQSEQLRRMRQACSDQDLRAIVEDSRRDQTPRPLDKGEQMAQRSNGWLPERPLRPPEGIREIDEIANAFDKRDRAKGLL
jgi:hypothetical protein